MNPALSQLIDIHGLQTIARTCGVTYQSVKKWKVRGFPRTEWSGETNYTTKIEMMTGGKVTREHLLAVDPKGLAAAGG